MCLPLVFRNRFAAVEITPPAYKSKAVTYVLTGGVIAAFLGPTSATYTIHIFKEDYAASFMAMFLIGVLNQIAVSLVNFPSTDELRTSFAVQVIETGHCYKALRINIFMSLKIYYLTFRLFPVQRNLDQ